jgi:hypothetical protein
MRLIISSPDNFPVLVKKYAPEASSSLIAVWRGSLQILQYSMVT